LLSVPTPGYGWAVSRRPLVSVSAITLGDYLLWNWSLKGDHGVLALIAGLTLPPLVLACLWLLTLTLARLIADAMRNPGAPLTRERMARARRSARARAAARARAQAASAARSAARATGASADAPASAAASARREPTRKIAA
jgi:hypothetical protein